MVVVFFSFFLGRVWTVFLAAGCSTQVLMSSGVKGEIYSRECGRW